MPMPIAAVGQAGVCRPKPSGSTQLELEQRRPDTEIWIRLLGTMRIPTLLPTPWGKSCRTHGGSTTCWATSGSGALIGTERIPRARLLIPKDPPAASREWDAEHRSGLGARRKSARDNRLKPRFSLRPRCDALAYFAIPGTLSAITRLREGWAKAAVMCLPSGMMWKLSVMKSCEAGIRTAVGAPAPDKKFCRTMSCPPLTM